MRCYFLILEAATHFGGIPKSICPEGQGSAGFWAVEEGAPLGADGADGVACELAVPELLEDRASIPAAMIARRTALLI